MVAVHKTQIDGYGLVRLAGRRPIRLLATGKLMHISESPMGCMAPRRRRSTFSACELARDN